MPAIRKFIGPVIRLALCVTAVWFIAGSVSLRDAVTLSDGRVLRGTLYDNGETVFLATPDGGGHTLSRAELATGSGSPVSFGLISIWRNNDKALLLLAVAVFVCVPFLQAARLMLLLRAQGMRMGFWRNVRLAFAGNFLNFAAPLGSTAGDVYKACYAARFATRKTEAAATVIIDRMIGLGTLLLSVGLIAALAGEESRLAILRPYLFTLVGVMLGAIAVYLAPWPRRNGLVLALAARLPRQDQLRRIDVTARELLLHKPALLGSVGITLVLQILAALSFAFLCASLGFTLSATQPLDLYAHFSAGEIVKAIPGPPQGLGTVELSYGYFFHGLASTSAVVSAALAMRLVNLAVALPGIAFTAVSWSRRRATAQMQPAAALA